jgi:hypothetical protein
MKLVRVDVGCWRSGRGREVGFGKFDEFETEEGETDGVFEEVGLGVCVVRRGFATRWVGRQRRRQKRKRSVSTLRKVGMTSTSTTREEVEVENMKRTLQLLRPR